MSASARTVSDMTNQVQVTVEQDVLDEPCPRCGSTAVRVVVHSTWVEIEVAADSEATDAAGGAFPVDDPLFDCRECGFEWGELVRDLMS
jgi:DNA-directed RNA polymerase subunit M/transcription elongation factor TFIIS